MRSPRRGLLALSLAWTLSVACASWLAAAPGSLRLAGEIRVPGAAAGGGGGGSAQVEPFALRVLPEGYALADFPERSIFGFPVPGVATGGGRLSFSIGAGEGALRFEAGPPAKGFPGRIAGRVGQGSVTGSFVLDPSPRGADYGSPVEVRVDGGLLRGSLLLPVGPAPAGSAGLPLAVLVAGPGASDRDGNNYQVPGRTDTLLGLAQGLAKAGVASFRYDKRGSGESLALAPDESELRFDGYVSDLQAVIREFRADPRFDRILVAGQGEGALVAAAALARSGSGPASGAGASTLSLALLAASSKSALTTFTEAIEEAPPEEAVEGRAILARLLAGGSWPEPSPYYADFFRPSFQAYLSSWLRLDLAKLLPALEIPVLLVQGDRDIQVDLEDFFALAALRPADPAIVIQGMNHVLKEVPAEVDANFAAFSDPAFPVAPDLVAALAAFVKGEALPDGAARVDGGNPPTSPGTALPASPHSPR